jgi:hypothetical protein
VFVYSYNITVQPFDQVEYGTNGASSVYSLRALDLAVVRNSFVFLPSFLFS